MRLVIHAGTHKTGSTYLQRLLASNQKLMAERGVYTQPDKLMIGNHGTAWMTLVENYRHVEAHVIEAKRHGFQSALLSSEDFETLAFDHRRASLVEQAALSAGATSVSWVFCLRSPGEYFTSLMAELSKAVFVDYEHALTSALRDGSLRVRRERKRYPLHWEFCFDYETHLAAFAAGVRGQVVAYDFRDKVPFPGFGILADLGVDVASLALPGPEARNQRITTDEAEQNRIAKLEDILDLAGIKDQELRTSLSRKQQIPENFQREAERALDRMYLPGMERILSRSIVSPAADAQSPHLAK